MTITDFQSQCIISDNNLEEFIHCHPKQIINAEFFVPVWKIEYKYTTQRGNQKTAVKYLFLEENGWDAVDPLFNLYIEKINEEHPERKVSNVEILDTEFLGKVYLELK